MKRRRIMLLVITLILSVTFASAEIPKNAKVEYDGKALKVPITDESFVELATHWHEQAYSGLFAAIAAKKFDEVPFEIQEKLTKCSKASKDHFEHAACVSEMLEHRQKHGKDKNAPKAGNFDFALRKSASGFLNLDGVATATSNVYHPTTSTQKPQKIQQWKKVPMMAFKQEQNIEDNNEENFSIRTKRGISLDKDIVVSKNSYNIQEPNQGLSAIGAIAKIMMNSLLAQKNKTESSSWQRSVQRIKLANKERKRLEKEGKIKKANLPFDPESKIDMLEKFAYRAMGENGPFGDLDPESPENMKKLAKDERLKKSDPLRKMLTLLRDGIKLGYGIAGKNTTEFDDKIMKVASPRFLSVVPEEDSGDVIDVISPSLFSLHNKGKGIENLTSLPNLVKTFNGADQQQWLDFIIEAAGVEDQATKLEKEMSDRKNGFKKKYEEEIRGKNGQPMFFTKKNVTEMYGQKEEIKISTFEKLIKSYSKDQLKQMNDTGYAVLTKDQLYTMYGPDSPFNNSEILEKLLKIHPNQTLEIIEKDIHTMARYGHHRRTKRAIILSPVVFFPIIYTPPLLSQAVILSPLVFSPIVGTPAVLGPIILSPWVFIPLILSPRVLSPLILTPMIFSPIVLSPLVLHPLIVSPGIFNPIVLTPLVLSPFILSPQVFTPVILSPLVLNPLIVNPMVGSPLVLSPFVLSPLILSPQALFAVVLSPYALSPLIASPLAIAEVVLSPSWLS